MEQWQGYIGLILQGAVVTIEITVLGCIVALIAAFIAGLGRIPAFGRCAGWPRLTLSFSAELRSLCSSFGLTSSCRFWAYRLARFRLA